MGGVPRTATSGGNPRGRDHWSMRVGAVIDVAPRLRRITLSAERFGSLVRTGPDECFGLMVPTSRLPRLRWYTIRAHRPDRREIDVDFVLHDHSGPGVDWARSARRGDVVGFRQSGSAYRPPQPCHTQLLLADETALPALATILESLPRAAHGVRAVIEVPDDSYADRIDTDMQVEWRHRGEDPPGVHLLAAARTSPCGLDYAWVCGESGAVKAVRRHLVGPAGMDRRRVMFSGYWRRR